MEEVDVYYKCYIFPCTGYLHLEIFYFRFLHSTFSPPISHGNVKAANVLLDKELMPRLCDTGLAILRPLTSNSVKIKVSAWLIFSEFLSPNIVVYNCKSRLIMLKVDLFDHNRIFSDIVSRRILLEDLKRLVSETFSQQNFWALSFFLPQIPFILAAYMSFKLHQMHL